MYWTDLHKFSGLVEARVEVIDLAFVFLCHMVINFWAKSKLAHPPGNRTGVPKWTGKSQRRRDEIKLMTTSPSTSGRNFVSFLPVTPEFTRLECVQ